MTVQHLPVSGHRDFRRLWTGRAVSQFGSDIGAVALPLIAVTVVEATAFQVTLLAAVAACSTLLFSFPIGGLVEYRRKRPVLIATDLIRAVALASVPLAAMTGWLTFAHLCVITAINTVCQIAFASASAAHLKALVSPERILDANSRLEGTTWLSLTVGRSLGGVLVAALSAVGTLLLDAASFLVGTLAILRLRAPEPEPPKRRADRNRRDELLAGLRFVRADPYLRRLLAAWIVFAGASGMAFPISTVFYLRDLGFTPWQYGLLMGIPSLGGFLGSRVVRVSAARWGTTRILRWTSVLRALWYALIPLAQPGVGGLVLAGAGFTGVLFFSSIANSTMNGYRQLRTPDDLQVRVAVLWTFATTLTQPVFILLGGVVAMAVGNRTALLVATAVMASATLLLPRNRHGEGG
ncbi:MFS transporter [Phytomonospora sp. NPDC050363]|uniref:MFS transporter n=1 Tax=Phytomonospora sp. NPDC050363 TaxID=3155642 RepID=UPI0033C8B417